VSFIRLIAINWSVIMVLLNNFDNNMKTLIEILSASIRNKKTSLLHDRDIDWQSVAYEADKHKVTALVYYFLMQNPVICVPDDIKERLRQRTLIEVTEQERSYLAFGEIVRKMVDSNIPVIILKGLFLRNLYCEPWLRSMNDYDILVKAEDFDKAGDILEKAGYNKVHGDDKHFEYLHPHLIGVELHKTLASSDVCKNLSDFERKIWSYSVPFKVGGSDVLTLSPTDNAIHLVLHMATHMRIGGFGLRQLCDWVLLLETYSSKIDWDIFDKYIKSFGLEIFTQALFKVCNDLFILKIPRGWDIEDKSIQEITDKLILDIFDSGVFGNESVDRVTANRMIHYNEGVEANTLPKKIQAHLSLLFPKPEKMNIRFGYARKYRFLLPVAWIHRLIHTIIRKDLNMLEKLAAFRPKRASEIYNKRSSLLHRLGLLKKDI